MGPKRWLALLVRTQPSVGALITRLTLGICMLPHGYDKLANFNERLGQMSAVAPGPLGVLVILAESFGALGLIVGFFGRFCALGNGLVMAGAIAFVHGRNGFSLQNQGYEYNLALLGLALAVMVMGSGALSFDRWLTNRMQKPD